MKLRVQRSDTVLVDCRSGETWKTLEKLDVGDDEHSHTDGIHTRRTGDAGDR